MTSGNMMYFFQYDLPFGTGRKDQSGALFFTKMNLNFRSGWHSTFPLLSTLGPRFEPHRVHYEDRVYSPNLE